MGDHIIVLRLLGSQTERLRDALVARFPTEQAFADLLTDRLGETFEHLSARVHDHRTRVREVIGIAEANHWLYSLIVKASEEPPGDPVIRAFRQEIQGNTVAVPRNPFETCCLTGDYVLVNRRQLRVALPRLLDPFGKRILVVRDSARVPTAGSPALLRRTGKSHSLQMISYLRQVRGDFDIVYIDLKDIALLVGPERPITPFDLGDRIARRMGYRDLAPEPPKDAQWSRWTIEYCDEFELRSAAETRTRWIVVDSFNHVTLLQPTLDLFKALALKINASLPTLRLVLLGWQDTLPPEVGGHLEQEDLEAITPVELIDFFRRAYEEREQPVTSDVVAQAVRIVLQTARTRQTDLIVAVGEIAGAVLRNPPTPERDDAAQPGRLP